MLPHFMSVLELELVLEFNVMLYLHAAPLHVRCAQPTAAGHRAVARVTGHRVVARVDLRV